MSPVPSTDTKYILIYKYVYLTGDNEKRNAKEIHEKSFYSVINNL